MTGGMAQMVNATWEGACDESSIDVRLLRARDTNADAVLGAGGEIFATPENLALLAGIAKDLFDRTNYDARDRINGRAYATLICAGSDGTNAVRQIDRICTGWRHHSKVRTMNIVVLCLPGRQTFTSIDMSSRSKDCRRQIGVTQCPRAMASRRTARVQYLLAVSSSTTPAARSAMTARRPDIDISFIALV